MKEIWLFGSNNGFDCSDNSKTFFEYTSKNDQNKILAIWVSRNKDVIMRLRDKGFLAYHYYSLNGIRYSFLASKLFISHSFLDINLIAYLIPWKKKLIQLWHGTPLKRLEAHQFPFFKKTLIRIFLVYFGRDCDFVCSSTPLNIDIYKRQFKVKTEQVLVTGQPRNDQLNTERVQSKQNLIKKNVILFMPTWREYETKFSFFSKESGFNIEKINEFLKLHNALLVIKLHPAEKKLEVIKILKSSPCIKIYNKKTDLYDFLKDVNILITDYSSIYFDYLLLDRPIIFTPFDFQEYSTKRGFYYDYNEVTPGLKAISWDDLLNKIDLYLNNPNLDNNFRTKIRNKFNKYQDGNNCRRLSEKMKQV